MSNSRSWDERGPAKNRQIQELGSEIASPEIHVGGASAAAVSASLGAASAELVVSLTAGRKRFADDPTVAEGLRRLQQLRQELLDAADEDEQALEALMDAYRTKSDELPALLERAARISIRIGRNAAEVVEIAAVQVPNASRFTVSDLGTAAAMAAGAVTAALLTARININMMEDPGSGTTSVPTEFREEVAAIEVAAARSLDRALNQTLARIEPSQEES